MKLSGKKMLWYVTPLVLMLSCIPVTININFPEQKVERAAEQIETEVRGTEPRTDDTSWALPNFRFALVENVAYAQEVDLKIDTPAIQAIVKKRTDRFPKVNDLLNKGFIGEGKDGLLKEREKSVLSLQELAQARKLVKEENQDRLELYKEIAQANNIPTDQLNRIKEIFAKENRKQLKTSQYYEDENGKWKQKKS